MSEESSNKKSKIVPILVILAFISPVLLSWMVFNYTDIVEKRGTSNHGDLVIPPRPIEDLAMIDPVNADRKESLHGKWSMLYVADTCDATCMENVYRMRQIHMMMDKHSLRVQKVLFLTGQSANALSAEMADYAGQQVINTDLINIDSLLDKFRLKSSDDPVTMHRLYIVDPLGNLMMKFESDANPRDIMSDLKKLLRASRIG
jgi:hypothetical protein